MQIRGYHEMRDKGVCDGAQVMVQSSHNNPRCVHITHIDVYTNMREYVYQGVVKQT